MRTRMFNAHYTMEEWNELSEFSKWVWNYMFKLQARDDFKHRSRGMKNWLRRKLVQRGGQQFELF